MTVRRQKIYPGYWKLYQGADMPYANLRMQDEGGWEIEIRNGSEILWPSGDLFPTLAKAEECARDMLKRVNV